MVYVIQVCWQLASRIRTELQFCPDPARKLSANLYDIYHCCVPSEKLLMMDRGTVRNMWSFILKMNLKISAFNWIYYKNISQCMVIWTSNIFCSLTRVDECLIFGIYQKWGPIIGHVSSFFASYCDICDYNTVQYAVSIFRDGTSEFSEKSTLLSHVFCC